MVETVHLLPLLSTISAGFPMICFVAIVWWLDRYDREPVWLVSCAFLWGAIGSIILALAVSRALSDYLFHWLMLLPFVDGDAFGALSTVANTVIVAPIVEEPAKALVLLFVIWTRHFDNMTDGFVYGSAAGLGFGMTENYLYFVQAESDVSVWGATVFVRTFYSGVMHATATAIVGAALGYGRWMGTWTMLRFGTAGMALAIGVHMLWNGLLTLGTFGSGRSVFSFVNLMIFPLEAFCTGFVFHLCLQDEATMLREELQKRSSGG